MNYPFFLVSFIRQHLALFLTLTTILILTFAQPRMVDAQSAGNGVAKLAQQQEVATPEVATPEVATPAASTSEDGSFALPFVWQGDATIAAQELAEVAPPLEAEVSAGDFQIAFVPAETGDLLRILSVVSADTLGTIRVSLTLDAESENPPIPVGEVVGLRVSARLYAPDASAQLSIVDESGSTTIPLESLSWTDYELTRQIAADSSQLQIVLEWTGVPANSWLELRGLHFTITPSASAASATDLSATDTPTPVGAMAVLPTQPPTPTPTPTLQELATATPLPATPLSATSLPTVEATAIISALVPTPTFVIVTSTPTPVDVLEEATRVAYATEWAAIFGPSTPTPANMATATPTLTPIVLKPTAIPENEATAVQVAVYATAAAFTTGTPTPYPPDAIVLIATNTPVPPTNTPKPTATPTPIYVLLSDIPLKEPTPTPNVPQALVGKIVFLSTYNSWWADPKALVMNPDGTDVGLLTTNFFYYAADERDAWSADSRFQVYSLRESGGEAHNAGITQVFYNDTLYNSNRHQLTYFGAGVAWDPAWSPTSESIALVSSESANDEIWVAQRGQWPPMQLTKNDWEWDHHPSFSPDGSEIVFSSNRVTGRRQIWMMSSSGENQRQITDFPFEAWDPVWVKYTN
jgi:hypothetical protein